MREFPRRIEVIDEVYAEVLRQKSPAEKLAMADDLWRFARNMISANLKSQHPDWTEEKVQRETALRLSHGAD